MRVYEFITINTQKRQQRRKKQIPSTPIADQLKHEVLIRKLTARLARQSNMVRPSEEDLRVAQDRVEIAQKRADLDYTRRANKL